MLNKESLTLVIKAIPDLAWLKDRNGIYLACNSRFSQLLGVKETEILGKNDHDLVDKNLADFFRKKDLKVLETRRPVVYEEKVVFADDNRTETLETTKTPLYDAEENLIGVLGIGRDLTPFKDALVRVELLNRLNEELLSPDKLDKKLQRITQAIVDIFQADFARIWMIKPGDLCDTGCMHAQETQGLHVCQFREKCLHLMASSGRYTHIDGGHRRVPFGAYKIGKVASQEDAKFLTNHVETDSRIHNHQWAKQLGLKSFAGYRLIAPNGEVIGVMALFNKQKISSQEEAQLESLAATTIHVIENAKAHDALQESESNYRSMMDSMIDPVYISNADKEIVFMNPAMIRRVGSEGTGKKCFKVVHNLESECSWCDFDQFTENRGVEKEITSPLDERIYSVTATPLQQKDGTCNRMAIFRDMTDYYLAVQEKEKIETQLQQARKMESIGKLAGGIAHDFNNILYPIIGFAEMSIDDLPETHPTRENLEDILHGATRASELVKQILTFSQQKEHNLQLLPPKDLITEALSFIKQILPADITIQTDFYNGDDLIHADATQFQEIIFNLCTNAYHAMEYTGGVLTIHFDKKEPAPELNLPPNQYLCLDISDTGEGILPENLEKVFDPYFTTKPLGKGSGLGLSVVHGIVKSYNGAISVDSLPGLGASFRVYLPTSNRTSGGI